MISKLSIQVFLLGIMHGVTLELNPACKENFSEGTGDGRIPQFYYSQEAKHCLPFFYKGTGGNDNRFSSEMQCMKNCSTKAAELYPEGDAVCSLKSDPGMCMARLLKFYYDTEEKACRLFMYGGCLGNGNRFETKEECESMCRAKSGRTLGSIPNPDEQTVDVGFIMLIVGLVVFAVAVIVSIALFVVQRKSKRTKMKKVPTNEVELS